MQQLPSNEAKSMFERRLERVAKHKVNELLLQACYLPFVAVGGITVTLYDVAQLEKNPALVFISLAVVLHGLLFAFWALVYRRLLLSMLSQTSFSRAMANAGLILAYGGGLFVGWLVHRYA